jgi:hypothetical protein
MGSDLHGMRPWAPLLSTFGPNRRLASYVGCNGGPGPRLGHEQPRSLRHGRGRRKPRPGAVLGALVAGNTFDLHGIKGSIVAFLIIAALIAAGSAAVRESKPKPI